MEPRCFKLEGLSEGGILVGDIKEEVPESTVCKYFGPKSSKSGWKYDAKTTREEQEAILSLYRKVYECRDMPNKELTLQFARGLILMSLGKKVDWCQFRDERRKHREGLRKKRELSQVDRRGRESEGEVCPATIGRRRLVAPGEELNGDFPYELKLTVKTEALDSSTGGPMGKKVTGKTRGVLNSPLWVKGDLEEVAAVIKERFELGKTSEAALAESLAKTVSIEEKLRRAKLLRSDREAMLVDYDLEIKKITTDELILRAGMETIDALLEVPDDIDVGCEQLSHDQAELESLLFRKRDYERTSKRSLQVVTDCNSAIASLEQEVKISQACDADLSLKVKSLKGVVVQMEQQLRLMEEGSGHFCFPRPILDSPSLPLTTIHSLNACPVCCLWYSCWDYVPASCGHCYHPWCLAELAKTSKKCLLNYCEKPFLTLYKNAVGIRPSIVGGASFIPRKVESSSRKDSALSTSSLIVDKMDERPNDVISGATDAFVSVDLERTLAEAAAQRAGSNEVSEWSMEAGDKGLHPSQSSQNSLPVNVRSADTTSDRSKAMQFCYTCNQRPPAIRLMDCGHPYFCFGCIIGKNECPFCLQKISGWEPLQVSKSDDIGLVELVVPKARLSDSLIVKKGRQKIVAPALDKAGAPPPTSPLVVLPQPAKVPILTTGLVHWCGDDVFKVGGKRSMPCDIGRPNTGVAPPSPVVVVDEEESMKEGVDELPESEEDESIGRQYKRKKDAAPFIETLNSTRIVDKSILDLLRSGSATGMAGTTSNVNFHSPTSTPILRGRGRPPGGAKTALPAAPAETTGPRKVVARPRNVPARLKDL